jgi:hypothetical protein
MTLWRALSRRRGLAAFSVGVAGFLASAAVALLIQVPLPHIHDEFSYLLAADTFAHGRLTNPPHPLWEHFESFHILVQPTMMSKYPPAPGMMLALGQLLSGSPLLGVWLGFGLMLASICWMLQAWLPSHWALLGALLALLRLGFDTNSLSLVGFGYWAQSYWGGCVAAAGGALVFGAVRRLSRTPRVMHAAVLGFGLLILANSRPFEGLVVSIPVGITLLVLAHRARAKNVPWARIVFLPLAGIMALGACVMAYNNFRITGHPALLPYLHYEDVYGMAPLFNWQPFRSEPVFRHAELRKFNVEWTMWYHQLLHSGSWWRNFIVHRLLFIGRFFLGPVLWLFLPLLPWRSRRTWWALGVVGIFFLGYGLETWSEPHYAAPIAALAFFLVIQGLRRLRVWQGRRAGQWTVACLLAVSLLVAAIPVIRATRIQVRGWTIQRAKILEALEENGGKHLVVVHYTNKHDAANQEWVYNRYDIDSAAVVWAREMDAAHNARLLSYFKDRQAWLLLADAEPPQLVPLRHGTFAAD